MPQVDQERVNTLVSLKTKVPRIVIGAKGGIIVGRNEGRYIPPHACGGVGVFPRQRWNWRALWRWRRRSGARRRARAKSWHGPRPNGSAPWTWGCWGRPATSEKVVIRL